RLPPRRTRRLRVGRLLIAVGPPAHGFTPHFPGDLGAGNLLRLGGEAQPAADEAEHELVHAHAFGAGALYQLPVDRHGHTQRDVAVGRAFLTSGTCDSGDAARFRATLGTIH